MNRLFLLIVLTAGLALGAEKGAPATQPMPLPTPAELQQMHDAGQFRVCLQQIARVLFLRGDAARPYDHYGLLLLRGDCLLHLEDRMTATDAYAAAGKSPEPAQFAEARATLVLLRNCVGLQFTPKPPSEVGPISVIEHADRKRAMLALYKQLLQDSQPIIDKALNSPTLVPIIDGTPTFIDLHSLDVAATGSAEDIRPTLAKVGDHVRELMQNELGVIDQRVGGIEKSANQSVEIAGYGWWGGVARRGLTTDDRESLRNDANYADRINSAAEQFQEVSRSLGGTGEKWFPIIERSSGVAQHARDVLAAE